MQSPYYQFDNTCLSFEELFNAVDRPAGAMVPSSPSPFAAQQTGTFDAFGLGSPFRMPQRPNMSRMTNDFLVSPMNPQPQPSIPRTVRRPAAPDMPRPPIMDPPKAQPSSPTPDHTEQHLNSFLVFEGGDEEKGMGRGGRLPPNPIRILQRTNSNASYGTSSSDQLISPSLDAQFSEHLRIGSAVPLPPSRQNSFQEQGILMTGMQGKDVNGPDHLAVPSLSLSPAESYFPASGHTSLATPMSDVHQSGNPPVDNQNQTGSVSKLPSVRYPSVPHVSRQFPPEPLMHQQSWQVQPTYELPMQGSGGDGSGPFVAHPLPMQRHSSASNISSHPIRPASPYLVAPPMVQRTLSDSFQHRMPNMSNMPIHQGTIGLFDSNMVQSHFGPTGTPSAPQMQMMDTMMVSPAYSVSSSVYPMSTVSAGPSTQMSQDDHQRGRSQVQSGIGPVRSARSQPPPGSREDSPDRMKKSVPALPDTTDPTLLAKVNLVFDDENKTITDITTQEVMPYPGIVAPSSGSNKSSAKEFDFVPGWSEGMFLTYPVMLDNGRQIKHFKCRAYGCGKVLARKTAIEAHLINHLNLQQYRCPFENW